MVFVMNPPIADTGCIVALIIAPAFAPLSARSKRSPGSASPEAVTPACKAAPPTPRKYLGIIFSWGNALVSAIPAFAATAVGIKPPATCAVVAAMGFVSRY